MSSKRKRGRPCKGDPKKINCCTRISLEEYDKLMYLSDTYNVSSSEIVRRALKLYYDSATL